MSKKKPTQNDTKNESPIPVDIEKKVIMESIPSKQNSPKENSDTPPSNETTALQETILALTAERDQAREDASQAKEKMLQHMAELENFKKRKNQEVSTFKAYAGESVINAFLPVIDNFSLASQHAQNAQETDTSQQDIINGFILIKKQLDAALEKLNVSPIPALGKPFDPNIHQAIGKESSDNEASDIVLKEAQTGYFLNDRVLRPSMVIVSE